MLCLNPSPGSAGTGTALQVQAGKSKREGENHVWPFLAVASGGRAFPAEGREAGVLPDAEGP